MLINPSGLIEFINSFSHPDGLFVGIAESLSSKAGVTAMWAHMVAGDIFATRWMWSDGVKKIIRHGLWRLVYFWSHDDACWGSYPFNLHQ